MTSSEFRAWLSGFCDGIDESPSPAHWQIILDKISAIDDMPMSYLAFHEQFIAPNSKWWTGAVFCEVGGIDEHGHFISKEVALRRAGCIEFVTVSFGG